MALFTLLLLLLAVILFVLDAFGVRAPKVSLLALGLACFAGAILLTRFVGVP
jgi:hypothetical protein